MASRNPKNRQISHYQHIFFGTRSFRYPIDITNENAWHWQSSSRKCLPQPICFILIILCSTCSKLMQHKEAKKTFSYSGLCFFLKRCFSGLARKFLMAPTVKKLEVRSRICVYKMHQHANATRIVSENVKKGPLYYAAYEIMIQHFWICVQRYRKKYNDYRGLRNIKAASIWL